MEKQYKTEREFLENYDDSKYKKPSVTVDMLIFTINNVKSKNYRALDDKKLQILMIKRKDFPFKDHWAIPGGFANVDESIKDSACRELKEETNLDNVYMEQLYTWGDLNRDPRTRVVSTAFIALVDKNRLTEMINPNACWFDVILFEEKDNIVDISLTNGVETINLSIKKVLREKTTDRYSFKAKKNVLAFDHDLVVLAGLERLKNKLNYTDIVFNMMPEYFTLGELQQVYEVILNKKLLDPAFRRIIKDKVVKTDKMTSGEGHRPSVLFKYRKKND